MWHWIEREIKVGLWYLFWPWSVLVGTPSEVNEDLPWWVKLAFALTFVAALVAVVYIVVVGVD